VMAVFAAIYMIPMIYRFTQSSHPRSGIVGCISFVVVSLSAKTSDGMPSIVQIAWTRGVAFVVGVVAAVIVNWILWPFVARHELRKALSAMLIYSSIIYRGVVAKYVYYEKGEEPGKEDIERSGLCNLKHLIPSLIPATEMLEGRLREGFVRIRQLMACPILPLQTHPFPSELTLADLGSNTPRNTSPRALQSLTIQRSHRWLRAILRVSCCSSPILTILSPAFHLR